MMLCNEPINTETKDLVLSGTVVSGTGRAVLFDLDGTLIDSVGIYFKIVEIVMEGLGLPKASRHDVLAAAEKDPFDWLQLIPPDLHHRRDTLIPSAQRIVEETYPPLFREKATLMSGALDIMYRLVARGIKIGIVTSTPRKHIHHKMSLFDKEDITHLITAVISADDAPRKKPAPDPLILCAGLLGTPVSECIYIGDTRIDIRAGKAAGMKTIAVSSGFDQAKTLAAEFPDALIDSVSCLESVLHFL
ncbi:MAG: HAD family hydrolase [Pseudomonadota bacterium]